MDGGESPLEVLSRAATMLQENQALTASEESTKQNATKQLPTTKWKRDRRCRLPEYSRKSDPKIPETFNQEPPTSPTFANGNHFHQDQHCSTNNLTHSNTNPPDTPLDMSVRQRGQPPSYAQTINNPGYRSSYRPSVITPTPGGVREDMPSGISMCDPIIDEHFRRSLGKDYLKIFSNNNVAKEVNIENKKPPSNANVIELMDNSGLTVDDHFAKALGDTWTKLNKKENDIESNATDKEAVMTV